MSLKASLGKTLVIAPHPDDEILGVGGTMARLAEEGGEVHIAIVTKGQAPAYSAESVAQTQAEAKAAHDLIGISKTHWLNQPAAELFETPHAQVNKAIGGLVSELNPETLFIPFLGDIHMDHQLIFLSSLVASRPHQKDFPRQILAYETLSETNWNAPYLTPGFHPNVFVNISSTLTKKLSAMEKFASQAKSAPHERSLESLRALATLRGATMHCEAAEAFIQIRRVM